MILIILKINILILKYISNLYFYYFIKHFLGTYEIIILKYNLDILNLYY